jgi:hypothetical protein
MGRHTVVILARRNCSVCGRWRPITDYPCKRRDPDTGEAIWLYSMCISCDRARHLNPPPAERLRRAENARIARRLRAEAEGRQMKAYKILNPWTGRRVSVQALNAYMKRCRL